MKKIIFAIAAFCSNPCFGMTKSSETKMKAEGTTIKANIAYLQKHEELFEERIHEIGKVFRSSMLTKEEKATLNKEYYPTIVACYTTTKSIVDNKKIDKYELSDCQMRAAQALRDFEKETDAEKKFLLLAGTMDRAQEYAAQVRARLQTPNTLLTELTTLEALFNTHKHSQDDIRRILVIGEKVKDYCKSDKITLEVNALETLSEEILPRMRNNQEFSLYLKLFIDQIRIIAQSSPTMTYYLSTSSSGSSNVSSSKTEEKKDI